jgi:hypothetical protein
MSGGSVSSRMRIRYGRVGVRAHAGAERRTITSAIRRLLHGPQP